MKTAQPLKCPCPIGLTVLVLALIAVAIGTTFLVNPILSFMNWFAPHQ